MRVVVQRVSRAAVRVEGAVVGRIGRGLLVLVGVEQGDTEDAAVALAGKLARLRVFPSEHRPIDRSVLDVGGAVLTVSQFTLLADTTRGNRPSFVRAAAPADAERIYERLNAALRDLGLEVATGQFAAMMDVELVNDGPVTIVL